MSAKAVSEATNALYEAIEHGNAMRTRYVAADKAYNEANAEWREAGKAYEEARMSIMAALEVLSAAMK